MSLKHLLVVPFAFLWFVACDDSNASVKKHEAVDAGGIVKNNGICTPAACPEPTSGIPCCTPNAGCGSDPTGLGLGCIPNPGTQGSTTECNLATCKKQNGKSGCCTPLGECGNDPFGNGIFCFAPPPPVDAQPLCALDKCSAPDGGAKPCCQLNGDCGLDSLGIGLCFPPPIPLCNLSKCPDPVVDGGPAKCCQLNGKCGVDTLGIGLCFPPPAPPVTCDLSACPAPGNGIKSCCQPNGECGWDSLNIGICFPPPPPPVDAGTIVIPPISTTPPDDPSIDRTCPSFLGAFGPLWGCCSPYGVCGTFVSSNVCALGIGTQIPSGPPPAKDSGVKEPFLRCTPPPTPAVDAGTH